MNVNDRQESAHRLFAEHVAAGFPDECEDLEIAGVDLEEINDTIVGCVAPFVGRSGYQAVHLSELRRCREELDTVLPDSRVTLKNTTGGYGHSSTLCLNRLGLKIKTEEVYYNEVAPNPSWSRAALPKCFACSHRPKRGPLNPAVMSLERSVFR